MLSSPRPARRGHRLWIPAVIALLAALGFLAIYLKPEFERNFQRWAMLAVTIIALLLFFLWFVFLSRFPGRVRLMTAIVVVVGSIGLRLAVRVEGSTDASGLPKLVWKWSPHRKSPSREPPRLPNEPVVASGTVGASLPDVPQFFGPERDGVVRNAKLDRDWKTSPPKLLWRQPIGLGWSSFVSAGGRIFTQEQRDDDELVTCYDLLTGRLLWTHVRHVRFSEWQGGDGPRSTPTLAGGHLFALGATGILDCLDPSTGQAIWSRDILKENSLPNLTWGISCSPLVFEDTVVVTGGAGRGPTVLAYRRGTGEPLWRAGSDKASYSSPVLATLAGRRVILSVNAATLTGHDPETGTILFEYRWVNDKPPKASQPVVLEGDRIFLSAGYGIGCVMLQIKAAEKGKFTATPLWKNLRMKTQFNSAAVRDGFLYGLDDGLLACVDAITGERKWKGGRYGSGQEDSAPPAPDDSRSCCSKREHDRAPRMPQGSREQG